MYWIIGFEMDDKIEILYVIIGFVMCMYMYENDGLFFYFKFLYLFLRK